jgi:glycogen debranching enzyme
VKEDGVDNSLRPNQVIAVFLDFNMLNNVQSKRIVDVVQKELLTPFGLRTLSKDDPNFVGVYAGDRKKRDRAYHNGTVWPWLLGPFTTAFLKVEEYTENKQKFAFKNFLKPLLTEQALKSGLGVINEIFDGDPPHLPRGCIAQAWSVAELFRSYVEDILYLRPENEKEIFAILGKTLHYY